MNKYPTLKERYGEGKAILSFWIDKDLKEQIKKQSKEKGMLIGKYIQNILKQAVEDNEEFKKKW